MIQAKTSIQIHPICMIDADYDYILDGIERQEKLILNGMWVAIVTSNGTDVKNNSAILYLVVNYIIIKYLYVNSIFFFIFVSFYFCVW